MPKTAKVHLGGREYVLSEKVMGVTQKWREHLRQSSVMLIFQTLDEAVASVLSVVDGGIENLTTAQVIPIARILPIIVNGLANSIDDVLELLFDYSPELKADREWLAENAFDSEAIAAFIEVLKLNFPIMALLSLLRPGSAARSTLTNLPSTNGAGNGTKRNTALSKTR